MKCFSDSLTVYVHDVTAIRTAKRNDIKYFNMHLQSQYKTYRSVSYCQELHEIFSKAQESKSPIKLTGFKRKLSYYNPTEEDIVIDSSTKLQVIEDVSFTYVTSLESVLTIKEILDTKKNDEKVSLSAYLVSENCPVIQTRVKKSGTIINKKEITANDNSGMVKITLWESRINDVPLNGVYKIKNAIVNEYNGTKSLNTNGQTIFSRSDHNIQPSKVTLTNLAVRRLRFAPQAITNMDAKFTCPICGKYAENGNSKLYKCPNCSAVVLASKLKEQHHLKIMFKVNFETRYVTMNNKNLKDYFLFRELEMSETLDEINESILTDEKTVIVVDNRNATINFEY